jgi:hypothetical protein
LIHSILNLRKVAPALYCLLIPFENSLESVLIPEEHIAVCSPAVAIDRPGVFQVTEDLTYNVSYASIDIGRIRIRTLEKTTAEGGTFYNAAAYIDSYSGIPFVDLHVIYESFIAEDVFSQGFRGRLKERNRWYETHYEFDYPAKKVHIRKGWLGSSVTDATDSLALDTLYQDGLSLFFYARKNLRMGRKVVIPTLIQEEKVRTVIDFANKRTSAKIDAVKYPIDVIEFKGNAEFVGVFGLTGEFDGWFSNDDARVPILAKMKVIIGNIRIELMKWNRSGWTPPAFAEQMAR